MEPKEFDFNSDKEVEEGRAIVNGRGKFLNGILYWELGHFYIGDMRDFGMGILFC